VPQNRIICKYDKDPKGCPGLDAGTCPYHHDKEATRQEPPREDDDISMDSRSRYERKVVIENDWRSSEEDDAGDEHITKDSKGNKIFPPTFSSEHCIFGRGCHKKRIGECHKLHSGDDGYIPPSQILYVAIYAAC